MRVLNVIGTAYRATLEEQDDTVVWLTHAMKGAGAELDVLLRGNAVNYAAKAQHIGRLAFGDRVQKQGPRLAEDVAGLIAKEIEVYIVAEDLAEHGLAADVLIDGLKDISRDDLATLFDDYDQIWHW
jgi:sulfur transfer complex TusBCD TusB component (DsrH family)